MSLSLKSPQSQTEGEKSSHRRDAEQRGRRGSVCSQRAPLARCSMENTQWLQPPSRPLSMRKQTSGKPNETGRHVSMSLMSFFPYKSGHAAFKITQRRNELLGVCWTALKLLRREQSGALAACSFTSWPLGARRAMHNITTRLNQMLVG